MKIERINDNQIKCTLTRSDLASRQIRMSELVYGNEKTKGLFQDMMEQASTEVGFEASDLPLMIEAIPVSMDCIVLMITKVEDADEMDTKFTSFTHMNEIFSDNKETRDPAAPEEPPVQKDLFSSVTASSMERLFSFDSLDTVIRFAHHVSDIYHGDNSLYKCPDNNRYYLLLSKSGHNIKEFGLVCNSALEYGSKEFYNFARGAYLNEHYEKILIGDAIQSLAFV
ncbi:MAG: adaptor protein MecA [Lachnospiraceae bacterium]|nr:adaptor protein MecA [Lachnospiraceae bacterium]